MGTRTPATYPLLMRPRKYSLTQRWVLALDATYRYDGNTATTDTTPSARPPWTVDSDSSSAFGLALAIEYDWSSKLGRVDWRPIIPVGRNTAATITPAPAVNCPLITESSLAISCKCKEHEKR